VQITNNLLRACPFLVDEDRLSLGPGLVVKSGALQDAVVGASHGLTDTGTAIMRFLAGGGNYAQLLQQAQHLGIKDLQLSELLGFLNTIGGLQVVRTNWRRASVLQAWYLLTGFRFAPLAHRYEVSLLTLGIAILRATTPVFLAIGVVSGLIWVAGFASCLQILQLAGMTSVIFFASILAHEGAHVWLLHHAHIQANILQRGMHLGLIHAMPPRSVDILSSVSGPLAGALIGIIAAAYSARQSMPLPSLINIVISLLHIISLLPLYGDGQSLKQALTHKETP
jgi:hypothetical protein